MQSAGNRDTFSVSQVPRHIHNGIDAPYAFTPTAIYGGIIVTSEFPATMPTGWQIIKTGTGSCQVQHNLGNFDQLMWVASPIGAGGATLPVPIIVPGTFTSFFPNANGVVEFSWFDANNAAAAIDTTFYFIGIQVNNKNTSPTRYTVF